MYPVLRKQIVRASNRQPWSSATCAATFQPGHVAKVLPHLTTRTTGSHAAFSRSSRSAMPELTGDPKRHDTDKFAEGLTGNCLCGSITVTINDKELFTKRRGHLCHCANCRKVAGSYVASNLVIEEEKVTITDRDGTLKEFKDHDTGSGNALGRFFCSGCGNPVKSVTPAYAGKVVLKMGMFPRIPEPEFETFGDHRHPWQGHHSGTVKYKIKAGQALLEE